MTSQHPILRRAPVVLAGAAVINAVCLMPFTDEWYFALVLFGPLLHGLVVGLRGADLPTAAAVWATAGLTWLVFDWIVNGEDRLFHIVLAAVMAGLVALSAFAGRMAGRIA